MTLPLPIDFHRRTVLLVALIAALATSLLPGAPGQANADPTHSEIETATDGFVFGYAPVAVLRTRAQLLCGRRANTLNNLPITANPLIRSVVAPNADTLYTNAFLDLRDGPVTVSYGDTGGRYVDFEFLDMYTEVLGNVGSRTTGAEGASVTVVPPGYSGPVPDGSQRLQATGWDVWMLGRTLVAGNQTPDARTLQASFTVEVHRADIGTPPPTPRLKPCTEQSPQDPASAGAAFFDELAAVLAADPTDDTEMLTSLASIGVTPGSTPSRSANTDALAAGVSTGDTMVNDSYDLALTAAGGWRTPSAAGHFGQDYLIRAATAKWGLGANENVESRYFLADTDSLGERLDGRSGYVVHIPPGEPLVPVSTPEGGWWSLTMYDNENFLVPNLLGRYSLGSDPAALHRNPDGSVDLILSAAPPPPELLSNWLPAPSGVFRLIFRQYVPTDTQWIPPAVTKIWVVERVVVVASAESVRQQLHGRLPDGLANPGHHNSGTLCEQLCAHPHDSPAGSLEVRPPIDVPGSLAAIGPVMPTVVLDSDLPPPPPHVQADVHMTVLIAEFDLGLRLRQPRSDQQQSRSSLGRRLCSGVDEFEDLAQLSDPTCTPVPISERADVVRLDAGGTHQSVQHLDGTIGLQPPADIERRSDRCGGGQSIDPTHLFVRQRAAPHHDAAWRSTLHPMEFDVHVIVDPSGAVQRGRRQADDGDGPSRPQHRGLGPDPQCGVDRTVDVHTAEDRDVVLAQLVWREMAARHRRCTQERTLPHAHSTWARPPRIPTVANVYLLRHRPRAVHINYTVGITKRLLNGSRC